MSFLDTSVKNVGKNDATIRGVVGVLLIVISAYHGSVVTALIGLALIATSYLRSDPIYTATKFDTNPKSAPAAPPPAPKAAPQPAARPAAK